MAGFLLLELDQWSSRFHCIFSLVLKYFVFNQYAFIKLQLGGDNIIIPILQVGRL